LADGEREGEGGRERVEINKILRQLSLSSDMQGGKRSSGKKNLDYVMAAKSFFWRFFARCVYNEMNAKVFQHRKTSFV
jgi:hypothetical protein